MEAFWRDAVKKENSQLAKILELTRVYLSRDESLHVCFEAKDFVEEGKFKRVKRMLSASFPQLNVIVELRYTGLKDQIKENLELARNIVLQSMKKRQPGLARFFADDTIWSWDDDTLVLACSDAVTASFLRSQQAQKLTTELFEELFGIQPAVRIVLDGDTKQRLEEISEARRQEEEILSKLALSETKQPEVQEEKKTDALVGKPIHDTPLEMSKITENAGRLCVRGEANGFECIDAKNGKSKIISFSLSDGTSSVLCKLFLGGKRSTEDGSSIEAKAEALAAALKQGNWVTVKGAYRYDNYKSEMMLFVEDLSPAIKPVRRDTAEQKRVELHLHTSFSTMDACASPTALIKQAAAWGHKAIAITDHGVVQAFPEAFGAAKKAGIKLIPGCEGYLIEDNAGIVRGGDEIDIHKAAYVVLDVETNGLNTYKDDIIELGAVRIENGKEIDCFDCFVNPGKPLPEKIIKLTGITDQILYGAPQLEEVIKKFREFAKDAVLVAHNADFDMAFMRRAYQQSGLGFDYPVLDTLAFVRSRFPQLHSHKLGNICKHLGIDLSNAHRAVHDARATSKILIKLLTELSENNKINTLGDLNCAFDTDVGKHAYHIILLAKTQKGMENLYRLVSEGHLNYFYRTPRIPRSLIQRYREGLIVGSACEAGELYRAILEGKDDQTLEHIASFYDYLEVQPLGNNAFLLREGAVQSEEELRDYNRKIIELGERMQKMVYIFLDVPEYSLLAPRVPSTSATV